jgi:hypothetical protein
MAGLTEQDVVETLSDEALVAETTASTFESSTPEELFAEAGRFIDEFDFETAAECMTHCLTTIDTNPLAFGEDNQLFIVMCYRRYGEALLRISESASGPSAADQHSDESPAPCAPEQSDSSAAISSAMAAASVATSSSDAMSMSAPDDQKQSTEGALVDAQTLNNAFAAFADPENGAEDGAAEPGDEDRELAWQVLETARVIAEKECARLDAAWLLKPATEEDDGEQSDTMQSAASAKSASSSSTTTTTSAADKRMNEITALTDSKREALSSMISELKQIHSLIGELSLLTDAEVAQAEFECALDMYDTHVELGNETNARDAGYLLFMAAIAAQSARDSEGFETHLNNAFDVICERLTELANEQFAAEIDADCEATELLDACMKLCADSEETGDEERLVCAEVSDEKMSEEVSASEVKKELRDLCESLAALIEKANADPAEESGAMAGGALHADDGTDVLAALKEVLASGGLAALANTNFDGLENFEPIEEMVPTEKGAVLESKVGFGDTKSAEESVEPVKKLGTFGSMSGGSRKRNKTEAFGAEDDADISTKKSRVV